MPTVQTDTPALTRVRNLIERYGPVSTVRVSSAQASGAARAYPYWGISRGEVIVTTRGHLSVVSRERAGSDRRSYRLAEQDRDTCAIDEHRLAWQPLGRLDESNAACLLTLLEARDGQ